MSAATMDDDDAPMGGSDTRTHTTPLIERPLDLTGRAVLLATDGSPCAIAAARVAHALATQHHAQVHVVSVMDTRPAPMPAPVHAVISFGDALAGEEVHRAQEREVCAELTRALGTKIDWPVRIMLGAPSQAIVQQANHIGAVLIVVGLRRHGRLDRARHDETSLNVMRTAACPVLGIVAEQKGLPRRILAAVDFGEGSITALRAACAVAGPHPTFVLGYVHPLNGFLEDEGEARIHDFGVTSGFEKLAHELAEEGLTFDHVVLHHASTQSIGQALLEYAGEAGCDLITAGSVHHRRIDRWMVGSVSTELVRDGRRSVLIVPPQRRE